MEPDDDTGSSSSSSSSSEPSTERIEPLELTGRTESELGDFPELFPPPNRLDTEPPTVPCP